MPLILGPKRERYLGKAQGDCPHCRSDSTFSLWAAPRQLTLGNRIRITTGRAEPVARCISCADEQAPAGLEQATDVETDAKTLFQETAVDILTGMLLADGEVDEAEMTMVERVVEVLEIPRSLLEQAMQRAQPGEGETALLRRVHARSPLLDEKGHNLLLASAFYLAQVDAHYHLHEEAFLKRVAEALDIPPGQYDIIIEWADGSENLFDNLLDYSRKSLSPPSKEEDMLTQG